jgi:hypothetical protein
MKTFGMMRSAATLRRLQWVLLGLAAAAAVAILIMSLPAQQYLSTPAPTNMKAPATDIYRPLDQHERHPFGMTDIYRPLDQHERHPDKS